MGKNSEFDIKYNFLEIFSDAPHRVRRKNWHVSTKKTKIEITMDGRNSNRIIVTNNLVSL